MGNGAKAQQKRDRNAATTKKGPTSNLAANASALSIICSICRQSFLKTSGAKILEPHAQNKHGKTMAECFPGVPTA